MFRSDLKFIGMPEKNDFPTRISIRFTCPKCGSHDLHIESADVLGCQSVEGLDEEGNLVLGRPTFYTEESDFYLSCECGHEPVVDLDDPEERYGSLIKYLKDSQHLNGSDEDGDDDDESED